LRWDVGGLGSWVASCLEIWREKKLNWASRGGWMVSLCKMASYLLLGLSLEDVDGR
jgi:hypothetical protein